MPVLLKAVASSSYVELMYDKRPREKLRVASAMVTCSFLMHGMNTLSSNGMAFDAW